MVWRCWSEICWMARSSPAAASFSAMLETQAALDYLAQRGIGDAQAIRRFQLGFSSRSLSKRLPSRQSQVGAEIRAKLMSLGIFRSSGHEHFAGSASSGHPTS
jgi:DNA primase